MLGDESGSIVTGRRIVAALIDLLALTIMFIAVGLVFHKVHAHNGVASVKLQGASGFVWALLVIAYYLGPEALAGQTLGKWMLGIRVVSVGGGAASPGAIVIRTLARIVDFLPFFYLFGAISILVTGSAAQRIGDLWAGTAVRRA